jgi:hypothetical protein
MLKKHPVINSSYGLTHAEKEAVRMIDPKQMDICYVCKVCKFKYSTRQALRQHFIIKHPRENAKWIQKKKEAEIFNVKVDGKYKCKWCEKLYVSKGSLSIHVHTKHPASKT